MPLAPALEALTKNSCLYLHTCANCIEDDEPSSHSLTRTKKHLKQHVVLVVLKSHPMYLIKKCKFRSDCRVVIDQGGLEELEQFEEH